MIVSRESFGFGCCSEKVEFLIFVRCVEFIRSGGVDFFYEVQDYLFSDFRNHVKYRMVIG